MVTVQLRGASLPGQRATEPRGSGGEVFAGSGFALGMKVGHKLPGTTPLPARAQGSTRWRVPGGLVVGGQPGPETVSLDAPTRRESHRLQEPQA